MEEQLNPQEHPNQPILEAILTNNDKHAETQENLLESILTETNKNNAEPLLEAQLVTLDKIEKKLSPKEVEDGATFIVKGKQGDKGDKGDTGDKPSEQELISIIKPLIPAPLKGDKGDSIKGDKGDKGDKPSEQELISIIKPLIPAPLKGDKGDSGKDGKDAKPISIAKLKEIIEPMIPKIKKDNGLSTLVFGKEERQITVSDTPPPAPYLYQLWYDIS